MRVHSCSCINAYSPKCVCVCVILLLMRQKWMKKKKQNEEKINIVQHLCVHWMWIEWHDVDATLNERPFHEPVFLLASACIGTKFSMCKVYNTHTHNGMIFSNACNTCVVCVCACIPRSIHIATFTDVSLELIDKRNFLKYTLKLVLANRNSSLSTSTYRPPDLLPAPCHAAEPIYSTFSWSPFLFIAKVPEKRSVNVNMHHFSTITAIHWMCLDVSGCLAFVNTPHNTLDSTCV